LSETKVKLLTISPPLSDLLTSCETECVADCCGLDAFDFAPEQIGRWIRSAGRDLATGARKQIADHINVLELADPDDTFVSYALNAMWKRDACIAWFNELAFKVGQHSQVEDS
jgi:hypothetical protein